MTSSSPSSAETLERIHAALEAAREVLNRFTPGAIEAQYKVGTDPVTEADHAVDAVLKKNLLRAGEGWLSEETVDDFTRLDKRRVWVVDPLDGTREFVQGIPEFCVSIAMVENGIPVAGGICNAFDNRGAAQVMHEPDPFTDRLGPDLFVGPADLCRPIRRVRVTPGFNAHRNSPDHLS